MKCPACGRELKQMKVSDLTLDVCERGCGGIWFDLLELKKVDEQHESAGEALLDIRRNQDIEVDYSKKRPCPKCEGIQMMKHFTSVLKKVEVDECGKCGGFWLDYGELGRIRREYPTEEERGKAARKYFSELFDDELKKMRAESEAKSARAEKIAGIFRFICPSYYLPGKQQWGAF